RTVGPVVVPYYQGFESESYLDNWESDASFDLSNELIYADFSASKNNAYLQSNKRLGPIASGHSLFFDYIYTMIDGTAVQMGLQDSISVWISDDCAITYELLHVISASNHTVSNAMTRVQLPLVDYVGSNIVVRFEMHSNTIDSRIKLDEIYIDGLPDISIPGNYIVNVCEGNTHNITVNGSSSFQYKWFEGSSPLVSLGTEQHLEVNQSGIYHVVATNGVGLTAQDSVQINIIPLPDVELNLPLEQKTLCPNAAFIYLSGNSPVGGTFSGSGVSVNRFYPENAGVGIHVITYTVTQNSCTNTATDTIEVFPVTSVIFSGLSDLCLNESALVLSQGFPTGGTYSGIGVSGNEFNPQTAGVNTHLITYSYTDDNNCIFTAVDTIVVKPLPNAFAGNNTAICQGDHTTLVASGGAHYLWNTQQNTNAIVVSPSQTTTYTVTVTGMNGCTNTSSVTVTVNEYPVATFVLPEDTVCLQTAAFELSGGSGTPAGGTGSYSGTGVSGSWFNPAIGLGPYAIRYTYSLNGCDSSITRFITVVNCTGIDENSDLSQIVVLPNPADESFSILFSELIKNANIVIYDVSGRKVFETEQMINESKKLDINSSAWTSGVYFIQVQSGNRSHYQKLIKR
ncbi:MAG: T9SS type A sorting domain-containing protein, partial [Bacteroidales bacterium]|nr:T9SS type A sorting domain-containing protein [Bacteroidales bacterium]